MKKLPIGIQTFRDIRDPKENYAYIDKTEGAYRMITGSRYTFLSRPRRFGKSLLLDTISEIFKGNKPIFEGLYIYDKWDWNETFPVIKISFAVGDFSSKETLIASVEEVLRTNCEQLNVSCGNYQGLNLGQSFERIIRTVSQHYNKKVVILVDEYDKPILDNIHRDDRQPAMDARDVLRNFYSAIKAADEFIRFVFLTGVSKFSKLNLFSGLNNLTDITLHEHYTTITGYTNEDLKKHFSEYLQDTNIEEVKRWYNGYNYFGKPIYNPFDILLFLDNNCRFSNYWWKTGNPSFLIEMLKKGNYYLPDLENITVSEETLEAFDIEHVNLVALLWQTGYLTFDERINIFNRLSYRMKIPNLEIQNSLNALFLEYLTNLQSEKAGLQNSGAISLYENNLGVFKDTLHKLFSSIPYTNYVNNTIGNYEGYYSSVVYTFLAGLGFDVVAEDTTNRGRIDMTIMLPNRIYIVEFKVDMNEEAAIEQIKTKRYFEKYRLENKEIIMLGIHFSSEQRNIKEFVWEIL